MNYAQPDYKADRIRLERRLDQYNAHLPGYQDAVQKWIELERQERARVQFTLLTAK